MSEETNEEVDHIDDMYEEWFLDYASYVILERAVPHINDGLKPVQRRILHSLDEKDDGRFNKVANIVGHTMQYHPHGDASIGDALVQLGQKNLLIETQGNWGNIITGDKAAASRYIEARLSKFGKEVVFSPKVTTWVASYDGRNKEPLTLPVKFPLVLAQGVEGIAVGLACKILPHNFNELIDASIAALRKQPFELYPDFAQGGMADVSDYNEGRRGGRVRVRARIEQTKKSLLTIKEIPASTTTGHLIDSILSANDKGKIKIVRVEDRTAEAVEVLVHLPAGTDPEQAIQGLYAFTDCEVSIAPNACVIDNNKPVFISIHQLLIASALHTRELLRQELEIRLAELEEKWHFSSLEKIFIENRIYRKIEECETWESVISTIAKGLKPYVKHLKRKVTEDDIVRLTEIRIKRISKYNKFKADEEISKLEDGIAEVNRHLKQLTRYAIRHFSELKKKFGKGRERRTELTTFERVDASKVVIANEILYVNRDDGFAGWGLKKDENLGKCSRLDDLIVFRTDGVMMVSRVTEKAFIGKKPLHVALWKKDDPYVYTLVYRDGRSGPLYAKKFQVNGITRDKEYDLTKGQKGSRIFWFGVHKNEEDADVVLKIHLKPELKLRNVSIEFDLGSLAIKGRGVQGNIVTKHAAVKVVRAGR